MPLKPGPQNLEANFHELRHGPQFARTARNHGTDTARSQMTAIALQEAHKHRATGGRASAGAALPANHHLGMRVPKGGADCAKCRFLASPTTCGNAAFVKWNGSAKLPAPADQYCCDLFEWAKRRADGGPLTDDDAPDVPISLADVNPNAEPINPGYHAEESSKGPDIFRSAGDAAYNLGTLPQRAFEASEAQRGGYGYDAGPILEAATLPMGTGAIAGVPVRGAETILGSGAVRGVKSGMTPTSSEINSLDELRRHISGGEPLFVRYSHGPQFDLKSGAKSIDHQTGEVHNGLSAVQLTPDMTDADLVRSLRDYASGRDPHVYTGKINGVDSDGAPTIVPARYIGALSDRLRHFIADESVPRRLDLQQMIDRLKNNVAPYQMTSWQQKFLEDTEGELNRLGGRVIPFEGANSAGAVAGLPLRAGEVALGAGPIRAYHGSPHDFDAFDLSKIGTGEGGAVKNAIRKAVAMAKQAKRANGGKVHVGPIKSDHGGRTDTEKMAVPNQSYVLSADVVSHLGENNSEAGLKRAQAIFGEGGHYDEAERRAAGGSAKSDGKPVDCITAGGEFVISPRVVKNIGGGDIEWGHKLLDRFSLNVRKDHIRTLASLPPPARD